jgi:hypothetical protein
MLTPQEISDQIEIEQVLNRYFRAIDTRTGRCSTPYSRVTRPSTTPPPVN